MRVLCAVRMYDGSTRKYHVDGVKSPEQARQVIKKEILGVRVVIALCKNIPEPMVMEAV